MLAWLAFHSSTSLLFDNLASSFSSPKRTRPLSVVVANNAFRLTDLTGLMRLIIQAIGDGGCCLQLQITNPGERVTVWVWHRCVTFPAAWEPSTTSPLRGRWKGHIFSTATRLHHRMGIAPPSSRDAGYLARDETSVKGIQGPNSLYPGPTSHTLP